MPRRHRFDVVVVWSCDRLARSTKHLLQGLDELNGFGIQFLSQREAIDTEGALGRAIIVIVSAIAELEQSLIVERVRAGMRRAKLEGRQIGRARLDINREQVVEDRRSGLALTAVAKKHAISRASVCRLMKEANGNSHATDLSPREDVGQQVRLYGELRNMTQDRIGKSFTVIFTNGDLPTNPMSLRECAVCGGVFTRDQSWSHAQIPCQPSLEQPFAIVTGRG